MKNLNKVAAKQFRLEDLKKMLEHFAVYNYLKITSKDLQFEFHGERLKQNIYNEWIISNSICCNEPAFHSNSQVNAKNLMNTLMSVKPFIKELPCSIIGSKQLKDQPLLNNKESFEKIDVLKKHFESKKGLALQKFLLCPAETAHDHFCKIQRDRKVWWNKFSATPGRYELSQIHQKDDDSQCVEILADFPWDVNTVEVVKYDTQFWGKNVKKGLEELPHVITVETVLEKAALTFLCDAYETIEGHENFLRFHRKLAPYKVAFAVEACPGNERQLKDLALLLSKQIRKCCLNVLFLADATSSPLEEQVSRNDKLGIPYTVLLRDNTLKDGLLEIHSRDTSLKEESHVSLLVAYVEKLMKNY